MTLAEFVELCESNGLVYNQIGTNWVYANINSNYVRTDCWFLAYHIDDYSTYLASLICTDSSQIYFSDYNSYSPTNFKNKLNIINGIIKSFKENEVNSKIKSIEFDFNS